MSQLRSNKSESKSLDDLKQDLLFKTLLRGQTNLAKRLIEKGTGIDVNALDQTFGTLLYVACEKGYTDIVQLLLDKGANVNQPANQYDWTPLMIASQKGNDEIVKILLAAGANPNQMEKDGETALGHAISRNKINIVKLLLDKGANVNLVNPANGESPLSSAVANKSVEIVEMLLKAGANPDRANIDKLTPLGAVMGNDETSAKIVKLLLAAGANPNQRAGLDGDMVLVSWSRQGHTEIVKLLLAAGADPDSKDSEHFFETSLFVASRDNYKEIVKLLLEAGADPNTTDNHDWTPLMIASDRHHVDVIKLLLETPNIDLNKTNDEGDTALFHAADDLESVKLLLAAGADPNIPDHDGWTALIAAAQLSVDIDIVKSLLAAGADPNHITNDEETAIIVAAKYKTDEGKHLEVIDYLLKNGAFLTGTDNPRLSDDIRSFFRQFKNRGLIRIIEDYEEGRSHELEFRIELRQRRSRVTDLNRRGLWGKTALTIAAQKGFVGIVKEILKFDEDVNLLDDQNAGKGIDGKMSLKDFRQISESVVNCEGFGLTIRSRDVITQQDTIEFPVRCFPCKHVHELSSLNGWLNTKVNGGYDILRKSCPLCGDRHSEIDSVEFMSSALVKRWNGMAKAEREAEDEEAKIFASSVYRQINKNLSGLRESKNKMTEKIVETYDEAIDNIEKEHAYARRLIKWKYKRPLINERVKARLAIGGHKAKIEEEKARIEELKQSAKKKIANIRLDMVVEDMRLTQKTNSRKESSRKNKAHYVQITSAPYDKKIDKYLKMKRDMLARSAAKKAANSIRNRLKDNIKLKF